MNVGDMVRVTTQCDAGGLWHQIGIIVEIPRRHSVYQAKCVRVLLENRVSLIEFDHLERLNESR